MATCGVGHIPLAPGTWGALLGIGLYVAFLYASVAASAFAYARGLNAEQFHALQTTLQLALLIGIVWVGTWAATRTEKLLGRKDPGAVVVDEVAGQLITFLFVPWGVGGWTLFTGFIAFRLFDIWKPYPIRRLEGLASGLGVMADDVLAGAYAATLMSLLVTLKLFGS